MAYKQIDYTIGSDHLNFPAEAETTRIFNSSRNSVGSLEELIFKGKTSNGARITDFKVAGVYKVTNLKGLPTGITTDKIGILSVTAVGNIGAPDLLKYEYISNSGQVVTTTSVGGKTLGFVTLGIQLQNQMNSLNNQIGSLSGLATTNNKSVGDAINEINHELDTGPKMNFASFLGGKDSRGTNVDLIGINSSNQLQIGDASHTVNIKSNGGLTINGQKVVTAANPKALNADTVDGFHANVFARYSEAGTWAKAQAFNSGVNIGNSNAVRFLSSSAQTQYTLQPGSNSLDMVSTSGGKFSISQNGQITATGDATVTGSVKIKANASDAGFSLTRTGSTLSLNGIATLDQGNSRFATSNAIEVQGRLLFLTGTQPTGSIPKGSIWLGA